LWLWLFRWWGCCWRETVTNACPHLPLPFHFPRPCAVISLGHPLTSPGPPHPHSTYILTGRPPPPSPYTQSSLSSLPNPITPPSNNPPIRHHPHHSPQPGNLNDLLVPTQQHAHGLPAAFAAASGVNLREPGCLGG